MGNNCLQCSDIVMTADEESWTEKNMNILEFMSEPKATLLFIILFAIYNK